MAVAIVKVLANFLKSPVYITSLCDPTSRTSLLVAMTQVRDKKNTPKRRVTHPYWFWAPRKRTYNEENITIENREFLEEVIKDKFLQPGESPLKDQQWERGVWSPSSRRTGVIAKKIGIYPMWKKDGTKLLTTLLQVVDNHVIKYIPPEVWATARSARTNKFKGICGALVVGAESCNPQIFTASYNGLFAEAGVMPKRKLTRFTITPDAALQPGTPLFATHFRVGDHVNVYGLTRGHGFQGVVKRWKFKGGPASHGCTKSHRRPGCIGGGSKKSGVWKGKKMPGHMGRERRLISGLKIWRINTKYNVIWVHGPAIPGSTHSYVYILDTTVAKKGHTEENPPPFPTYFPGDEKENLPEEFYDSDLHVFSNPTITFEDESQAKKRA